MITSTEKSSDKPRVPDNYGSLPVHEQLQYIFDDMATELRQFVAAREIMKIRDEERRMFKIDDATPMEVKIQYTLYLMAKARVKCLTRYWNKKHPLRKFIDINLDKSTKYIHDGDPARALKLLVGVLDGLKQYSGVVRRHGFIITT